MISLQSVFAASRDFHALPLPDKMAIGLNELHRGYIPINTSTDRNSELAEVTKPNQSASFMMMTEAAANDADVAAGTLIWLVRTNGQTLDELSPNVGAVSRR